MSFVIGILITSSFFFGGTDVSARCTSLYSISEDEVQKSDEVQKNDDLVTIQCGIGAPRGWQSGKNGSTYVKSTKGGTRIYSRKGGATRANKDFHSVIEPSASVRKYVKANGDITFVKSSASGYVRYYKSHSGQEPTLSYGKDKIRYP